MFNYELEDYIEEALSIARECPMQDVCEVGKECVFFDIRENLSELEKIEAINGMSGSYLKDRIDTHFKCLRKKEKDIYGI